MAEFHNAGYKKLYNRETLDDNFSEKIMISRRYLYNNHAFYKGETEAKDVHYEACEKGKKCNSKYLAE